MTPVHIITRCSPHLRIISALTLIFALSFWGDPGWGKPDLSVICESTAQKASSATGVPLSVLKAISLTETGRRQNGQFRPWPWTVNMEGKGVWFSSSDEAKAYVYKHYKRGARSFDVGCFQLNYKWHGKAFSSIDEMFDPTANSMYAAKFLLELYQEMGNWTDAAGAYHSRTPKYANKYKKRFNSIRARLTDDFEDLPPAPKETQMASLDETTPSKPKPVPVTRINRFPLLIRDGHATGVLGSLVPLGAGINTRRFIGGN